MNINKLIEIFKSELKEEIEDFSRTTLEMNEGSVTKEQLENIFINVHTIKGSSITLYNNILKKNEKKYSNIASNLKIISNLTHDFEDFLEILKNDNNFLKKEEIKHILKFEEIIFEIQENFEESNSELLDKEAKTLISKIKKINKKQLKRYFYEITLSEEEFDEEYKHVQLSILYNEIKNKYKDYVFNPTEEEVLQEKNFKEIFIQLNTEENEEEVSKFLNSREDIKEAKLIPYIQKPININEQEAVLNKKDHPNKKRTNKTSKKTILKIEPDRIDDVLKHTSQIVVLKNNLNELVESIHLNDEDFLEQKIEELKNMIFGDLNTYVDFLQESVLKIRMTPLEQLFFPLRRDIRKISEEYNKELILETIGSSTEIDKTILDELPDVLLHLVRNSICHGIETPKEREEKRKDPKGKIRIEAKHEKNMVTLSITDDGKGIDIEKIKEIALNKNFITKNIVETLSEEEIIDLIFISGLSSTEKVNQYSGRGVGMNAVRKKIENLKGSIKISTKKDKGTKIKISLPLTTSIIQAIIAKINNDYFTFPTTQVEEVLHLDKRKIKTVSEQEVFLLRDKEIPIIFSQDFFNLNNEEKQDKLFLKIIVLRSSNTLYGFTIDEYLGQQNIVVKNLGILSGKTKGISGSNILGDGSISLIVDTNSITETFKKTNIQ